MTDVLKELNDIAAKLPPQDFEESGLLKLALYDLKIGKEPGSVSDAVLDKLVELALGGQPDTGKIERYETPDDDFRRGVSLALHSIAQRAPEWSEGAIARLEEICASNAQWEVRIRSMQSIMNLGEEGAPHTPFAVTALTRQAKSNSHSTLRSAARGFLGMIADKQPEVKSAAIASWVEGTQDLHPIGRYGAVNALNSCVDKLGAEEAGKLMCVFEAVASKSDREDTIALAQQGMEIVRRKTSSPSV